MEFEKRELKDDEIRCSYCGKIIKKEDAVPHEIFYRGFSGGRKTLLYCSKQHGFYDQMGHEG